MRKVEHESIYVPIAGGICRIDCTCGWRSKVHDDNPFDPNAYSAAEAFIKHAAAYAEQTHYNYACPNCHSPHNLRIVATVWVNLVQHGNDVFETELDDDGHEWDSESNVECLACQWLGRMKDAEVEVTT